MADQDLTQLREVAEAATPGPWVTAGRTAVESVHDCSPQHDCRGIAATSGMSRHPVRPAEEADATHIATFDPPTVLALLDRLEAAEATVRRVKAFSQELRSYCSPHGVSTHYADRLDTALDGRDPIDRLRERLTEGMD